MVLAFAFGIGLTVCPTCICLIWTNGGIVSFDLTVDDINFWRLINDGADLLCCFPFLLLSLELIDLENKGSSSSDSWIPSNLGFLSKFDSIEWAFANVSL